MSTTDLEAPRWEAIGIDIGGSGIKAAPVDFTGSVTLGERLRCDTPQPSRPDDVVRAVADLLTQLPAGLPIGVAFPGVVLRGFVRFVGNLDPSWVGYDLAGALREVTGRDVPIVNDADAAALCEAELGVARGVQGRVVMTTLGTGIGTGILEDGILLPNFELGQLLIDGERAELAASAAAREREDLSWRVWAARLQRYYSYVEGLLWPQLFVVGGGVSKKADKFLPLLELRTPIVAAAHGNNAGIIGAARLGYHHAAPLAAGRHRRPNLVE